MNYFLICFIWFFFGFQHSLLARPIFKKLIKKIFGIFFLNHFYRSLYFVSQCIIFLLCWDLIKNIDPGFILYQLPQKYDLVRYFFNVIFNIFLILTVLHFDVGSFIGLNQVINIFFKKKEKNLLNQNYLYKYIRHPMYLGIILTYISSTGIYSVAFFLNLFCIVLYIEIGLHFEEKTLANNFGINYLKYQKKTFRYIPFIR